MINKFKGSIIGTAIGDALGAPMEIMYAKDIAEKYPEFTEENCEYMSKGNRKAGEWTDDTQLMIPTIQSLITKVGIHPPDIAKRYVEISNRRGWGRSTIHSVKRVSEGVQWFEASEESMGIGNGAAMKAAPLGLLLSNICKNGSRTDVRHCLNSIVDVGKITHKDIGIRAGFLQSLLVCLAILNKQNIIQKLKICEIEYFGDSFLSNKVEELSQKRNITDICQSGGVTSKAKESWPTTAAIYLLINNNQIKPITALFDLIKEGGDCDTTGAMLGALIGARYGSDIFPSKLIKNLEMSDYLLTLSENFFYTFHYHQFSEHPSENIL